MPNRAHSAPSQTATIPSDTLPGTTALIATVTNLLDSQQIHYRLADRIAKSIHVSVPADATADTSAALLTFQEALEKLKGSVKTAKAGHMVDALVRLREADAPQA